MPELLEVDHSTIYLNFRILLIQPFRKSGSSAGQEP